MKPRPLSGGPTPRAFREQPKVVPASVRAWQDTLAMCPSEVGVSDLCPLDFPVVFHLRKHLWFPGTGGVRL